MWPMYSTRIIRRRTKPFDAQYRGERNIPLAAYSAARSRARRARQYQNPTITMIQYMPGSFACHFVDRFVQIAQIKWILLNIRNRALRREPGSASPRHRAQE